MASTIQTPNPPYLAWYNPTVSYIYHIGGKGHSIKDCMTFKKNMLDLIDSNLVQPETIENSTLRNNHLSNHERVVNVIEEDGELS